MLNKVLIRVDGSVQIGLGHVVRCIAMAQMLKDEFQIHFISSEIPESIIGNIISKGFEFTKIETEETFFKLLTGKEIVVLDNYFFDTAYQKRVKKISGCKLVCIDDLHDKEFYADLIINHAPGVKPQDYHAQAFTQFALGLDYALLRPAFLKAAKEERKIEKIETVFICFGGADPKNYTELVLKKVLEWDTVKRIIIVTGTSYYFQNSLNSYINNNSIIEIYNNIEENEILKLMTVSDLAVVPASGILFEVLAAGCLVISSYYINNQKSIFEGIRELNAFYSIDYFENLNVTIFNDVNRSVFLKVIDGNSNVRILDKFKQL